MSTFSRTNTHTASFNLTLLFLCIAFSLTGCASWVQNQVPQETPTPTAPPLKTLGSFRPIQGTPYLVAAIEQSSERNTSSSSWFNLSSPSGYTSSDIHNYIFLDTQTALFQQLLPTNDFGIIFRIELTPEHTNPEQIIPPLGFLYGVVKADTNNDGNFSGGDQFSLATSTVGGQGYTEYITDVTDTYGYTLRDDGVLFLIYLKDDKKQMTTINLVTRTVLETQELPSFGSDVR